jgi:hypothetical protein
MDRISVGRDKERPVVMMCVLAWLVGWLVVCEQRMVNTSMGNTSSSVSVNWRSLWSESLTPMTCKGDKYDVTSGEAMHRHVVSIDGAKDSKSNVANKLDGCIYW